MDENRKNSTEIIQEYMVYYLNGERFASSTMQGGKRAYGEIVSILPPCLLEGNVLKTLNSISEIGNDLEFKFAKCVKDGQELDVSYGCPTIKLESQQIFFKVLI